MHMKLRRETVMLGLIFLAALLARLFIAFGSDNFSYDAYFNIGQVEGIKANLIPSFNYGLYYSPHPFVPLFHYILAFFGMFIPLQLVLKVLPNLFASLAVFLAYLISLELTKSRTAALFSALSAGFIPVFVLKTANSVSEYSLAVPLTLFLVYLMLRLDKANSIFLLILSVFALALTHSTSLVFVSGISLYVVMLYVLGSSPSRAEREVILFSVITTLWIIFLFFKEIFLLNGFSAIWHSSSSVFSTLNLDSFNILDAIYRIGVLTFVAGIFVIYRQVFEERKKGVHILISSSLIVLVMISTGLIGLDAGLIYLGVFFAVLSGEVYEASFAYVRKMHISRNLPVVYALVMVIFLLTSVIPSVLYKGSDYFDEPSSSEVAAFSWLASEPPSSSVVFADLKEGSMVPAVSRHKNFVDTAPSLSADVGHRVSDLNALYSTKSQVAAVSILEKYGISYLVITKKALESRNITGLDYYSSACFDLVYENSEASIYRSLCRVG